MEALWQEIDAWLMELGLQDAQQEILHQPVPQYLPLPEADVFIAPIPRGNRAYAEVWSEKGEHFARFFGSGTCRSFHIHLLVCPDLPESYTLTVRGARLFLDCPECGGLHDHDQLGLCTFGHGERSVTWLVWCPCGSVYALHYDGDRWQIARGFTFVHS